MLSGCFGNRMERVGSRLASEWVRPLRYAREFRGGGKRRIVLATDRPIYFREAFRSPPRWSDYAITLVELIVDEKTGKGEGVLAVGVKIKHDKEKNQLVLEHYDSAPISLKSVRMLK